MIRFSQNLKPRAGGGCLPGEACTIQIRGVFCQGICEVNNNCVVPAGDCPEAECPVEDVNNCTLTGGNYDVNTCTCDPSSSGNSPSSNNTSGESGGGGGNSGNGGSGDRNWLKILRNFCESRSDQGRFKKVCDRLK